MTGIPTPEIIVTAPTKDPNRLTLIIGGNHLTGWEEVEVTLRAEGFPNSFEIKASMQPGDQLPVSEGAPCQVKLGNDVVITGYVDKIIDSCSDTSHSVTISGRGKTQDLVDCGAEWPSGQLIGGNAQTIATNLAQVYGIDVVMVNSVAPGPDVAQWPLNYGETAAEIIQRVARNAGILAYEDHLGRLAFAAAGSVQAASGIAYGDNVQESTVTRSMEQRFSEYVCCTQSLAAYGDLPGKDFYDTEHDPNVPRHRRMYLVVEQVATDPEAFTKLRAQWEVARRAGRANPVTATIDAWRDSAGQLWTPNTLIPVSLPAYMDGTPLVISEVIFKRDNTSGTTAAITAMAKSAFAPEPIVLAPVNTADITGPGAGSPPAPNNGPGQ